MKDIDELIEKGKVYRNRRFSGNSGDGVPLDARYFGVDKLERREPLIKHPCVHLLGSYVYW